MPPKAAASKAKKEGPTYLHMVIDAVKALKVRGGASRQAIKAYIEENYNEHTNAVAFDTALKNALRKGAADGFLLQSKQSFRVNPAKTAAKPKAKKAATTTPTKSPTTKAATTKARKPRTKTAASTKKRSSSSKSKTVAKSPRKSRKAKRVVHDAVPAEAPKKPAGRVSKTSSKAASSSA